MIAGAKLCFNEIFMQYYRSSEPLLSRGPYSSRLNDCLIKIATELSVFYDAIN